MTHEKDRPVVIVGAGISGLSLAYFLAGRGVPTVVIEKEPRPGGLARSFQYDGFTFDIGPHRFHTDVPQVNTVIKEILGKDARNITRQSQVRFKGNFYPWPLHPSYVMLTFPPLIALSVLRDLFTLYRQKSPIMSFRDHVVNLYGKTLYRHFFEGYTSKFLGIVPELTHSDWAKTGIDRAIIDNRLKIGTLWQLIKSVIFAQGKKDLDFLYPVGGCEVFVKNLAEKYIALGGELLCGQTISEVEANGKRIESVYVGQRQIRPSELIWTGTVHTLTDLLGMARPKLNYLALVCYNLMLTEGKRFGFQWCYHGESDVLFSRVSIPENFDAGNTPPGRRAMCVEVPCMESDKIYANPENRLDRVYTDLKREGLLMTDHEVTDVRTETLPWAYPIYELEYRNMLASLEENLAPFENLTRGGRLGLFWYNNMDQCIEKSLEMSDRIMQRLVK